MIKEPPMPETTEDDATRMYLKGDELVAELSAVALANFHWSLWSLATSNIRGAEFAIRTASRQELSTDIPIDYCKILLVGEGPVAGRLHNPNAQILHRGMRVDLWINRAQAVQAYEQLEKMSGKDIGQQVTLFGRLTICLTGIPPDYP